MYKILLLGTLLLKPSFFYGTAEARKPVRFLGRLITIKAVSQGVLDISLGYPWGSTRYILGSGGAARPHKPLPDLTKTLNEFFLTSLKVRARFKTES